jgi:hypothetical protein
MVKRTSYEAPQKCNFPQHPVLCFVYLGFKFPSQHPALKRSQSEIIILCLLEVEFIKVNNLLCGALFLALSDAEHKAIGSCMCAKVPPSCYVHNAVTGGPTYIATDRRSLHRLIQHSRGIRVIHFGSCRTKVECVGWNALSCNPSHNAALVVLIRIAFSERGWNNLTHTLLAA